jgi:uncharacterized protein (DUF1800 family)
MKRVAEQYPLHCSLIDSGMEFANFRLVNPSKPMRPDTNSFERGLTVSPRYSFATVLIVLSSALSLAILHAADPPPPIITGVTLSNSQQRVTFSPSPAAQQYKLFRSFDLNQPFLEDLTATISGFDGVAPTVGGLGFYRLQAVPMNSNELLTANVLNRLAYGPTPDELERVRAIGADAFIQEQLAPESISENLAFDDTSLNFGSGWQLFTDTGTATSTNLYIYLTAPGDCFIDDLRLVVGTNANPALPNLIRNGDFELPLTMNDWTVSANHSGSAVTTALSQSAGSSLHIVASAGGTTLDSSIWQALQGVTNGVRYTLSYWYHPSTNNQLSALTIRLSGSDATSGNNGIYNAPYSVPLRARLDYGVASLADLRAWHVLRAVESKRQLLEVLLQFFDNHFVTQQEKAGVYFDSFYSDEGRDDQVATQNEFKELQRWRQALLNPQCTFYDLLKISAESPSMIIYLDTVTSAGNGTSVANENYARELLELFTYGVDSGYDQNDIVQTSRAWTGWRLRYVDTANEFNPFAGFAGGAANITSISNQAGIWAFNYRFDRHYTNSKSIFPAKTVPARFGAPWAGRNYELTLAARTGTNSIQDGYDVIAHLANQPFTAEFLSVKLCRLFVHDNFIHNTYDYTDPNLSAEGQLIKQCMLAWENGNPKGQIREVLRVIFNSDLFRSHGGSMQKIKTPFEFTVSAIRALRAAGTNGTFTANTDGTALATPMSRMGNMNLFNRAEPDGYAEGAGPWISAGTLAERLRWITAYCAGGGGDAGNSTSSPVALLQLKLPQSSWSDAGAVADYFLSILFPGEGPANLTVYRQLGMDYLNTDYTIVQGTLTKTPSPFSGLPVSTLATSPYDLRVRGMVAMLMSSPRFHEQ